MDSLITALSEPSLSCVGQQGYDTLFTTYFYLMLATNSMLYTRGIPISLGKGRTPGVVTHLGDKEW